MRRSRGAARLNRLVSLGIKYIPVIATLLLTIHVALLLCGIYEPLTVGVGAILLVVLMMLLSSRFDFCILHRSLISYMGVMTICIVVNKLHGFGRLLTLFRILMLVIGIALLVWAVIKGRNDGCCE